MPEAPPTMLPTDADTDTLTTELPDTTETPAIPSSTGARFLNCPDDEDLSFSLMTRSNEVFLDITLVVRDSEMRNIGYVITEGPADLNTLPGTIVYREEYSSGVDITAVVEDTDTGLINCSFKVFFSGICLSSLSWKLKHFGIACPKGR